MNRYALWLAGLGVASSAAVALAPAQPAFGAAPRRAEPPGAAKAATPLNATSLNQDTCANPQRKPTLEGDPRLASVPALASVRVTPSSGALVVSYHFRAPVALAPEGVYISWTVYLYRHRADAGSSTRTVELQLEDRGKGWQPEGWTILAASYYDDRVVAGNVYTDKARDELSVSFPAGFVDLAPPFYWFASQEEYRAYWPKGGARDWSVNGSAVSDCPAGIRESPDSLPYAAKLLSVTS